MTVDTLIEPPTFRMLTSSHERIQVQVGIRTHSSEGSDFKMTKYSYTDAPNNLTDDANRIP